ncbi:MAG: sulfatase-like hydrolase/transferase [Methylotenera sp.]|nr:sulfatase-like hydrolase/transferase [Methylotenera sp.]
MKKVAIHLSYHLALLFILPIAFIVTYVWLYFHPSITIYEHLGVIALIVFSILSIKLLLNHYLKNKKLVLFVSSILYSSFILGVIIYYALVLIGLYSWNKVITEEFIVSYANQAGFFFDAINVSYHLIIVALVILYTILTAACYFFLRKFHWLPTKQHNTTWLIGPLIFSFLFFCCYFCYDYLISSDAASKEPVKLTLHSGKPKGQQTHKSKLEYATDQRLNNLEDQARKNYQINISTKKRNLIVFVVDALRPDHTNIYDYHRDTTPNLRKISESQATSHFTNVRSVCGETTCAHAGFMASRFVHQLPDNIFTLQEALKLNGYRTNFIISGDHVNFHNIREVYGHVDDYFDGSMATGYYFNDDIITINKTDTLPIWDGKPTMIHYHILSAHQVGKKDPAFTKYMPSESYLGKRSGQAEIKFTNFYDNGVLQADDVIKKLLDTLSSKKYLDNTLVIITADHGEALGEHGFFMHTNSVIEEALHVPLMMIPYGYQSNLPKQSDEFMSLVDLAPTILSEFNLSIPETWIGKPVQHKIERPFTFFEMTPYKGLYDHRDKKSLWKYWNNTNTGEEFVFNITQDPKENNNLVWRVSSDLKKEWRKATQFEMSH